MLKKSFKLIYIHRTSEGCPQHLEEAREGEVKTQLLWRSLCPSLGACPTSRSCAHPCIIPGWMRHREQEEGTGHGRNARACRGGHSSSAQLRLGTSLPGICPWLCPAADLGVPSFPSSPTERSHWEFQPPEKNRKSKAERAWASGRLVIPIPAHPFHSPVKTGSPFKRSGGKRGIFTGSFATLESSTWAGAVLSVPCSTGTQHQPALCLKIIRLRWILIQPCAYGMTNSISEFIGDIFKKGYLWIRHRF